MILIGAALALGLGILVARRIVRSLTKVKGVCEALADGDLTRSSGVTSRDEPGQMAQALDRAVENLRNTVRTIDAWKRMHARNRERLEMAEGVTESLTS